MELDILTKVIIGIISSLGTAGVIFLNFRQAAKLKAELLDQFDSAVRHNKKHTATELFRLIHGIRMSFTDIKALIQHDECSKIIYALKKTPGIVAYKSGNFEYAGLGSNRLYRFIDRWMTKLGLLMFSTLSVAFMLMFSFGHGNTSITGFIMMIICATLATVQLRQRRYDQMIDNLVNSDHNK